MTFASLWPTPYELSWLLIAVLSAVALAAIFWKGEPKV